MSRPEPAQEPSMDEILASIRKIIAEDPVDARPNTPMAESNVPSVHSQPAPDVTDFRLPSVLRPKPHVAEARPSLFGRALSGVKAGPSVPEPSASPVAKPVIQPSAATPGEIQITDLVSSDLGDLLAEAPVPAALERSALEAKTPAFPGIEPNAGEKRLQDQPIGALQPKPSLEQRLAGLSIPGAIDDNLRGSGQNDALGALVPSRHDDAHPLAGGPEHTAHESPIAFSAIRPGAESPAGGGWPRSQAKLPERDKPENLAAGPETTSKRSEPVVLASMPAAAKPRPQPGVGEPVLRAPQQVASGVTDTEAAPGKDANPGALASQASNNDAPPVAAASGHPEVLASMGPRQPKPSAISREPETASGRAMGASFLPPLKPVLAAAAPTSPLPIEALYASEGIARASVASGTETPASESAPADVAAVLGELARGLAASTSKLGIAANVPTAPDMPVGTGEINGVAASTGTSGSDAEVTETARMPSAATVMSISVPDAPAVQAGRATIAPVKPNLPQVPAFVAPAVQAADEAAATTGSDSIEPQVDALATLSAAMTAVTAASASPALQSSGVVTELPGAGLLPLADLEHTVAELLRPMLRQWLSDNMPRIVEKALRIELAQGLKNKT